MDNTPIFKKGNLSESISYIASIPLKDDQIMDDEIDEDENESFERYSILDPRKKTKLNKKNIFETTIHKNLLKKELKNEIKKRDHSIPHVRARVDLRFQKFVKNKARNSKIISRNQKLNELFVNCVHNDGSENIEIKKLLDETGIRKKSYSKTNIFDFTYQDSYGKNKKMIGLANCYKLVLINSIELLVPEIILDFEILNLELFSSHEMEKLFALRLKSSKINFWCTLTFSSDIMYNNFKKFYRNIKNKADPYINFNFDKLGNTLDQLFMNEKDFLKTANSGDLLLFK